MLKSKLLKNSTSLTEAEEHELLPNYHRFLFIQNSEVRAANVIANIDSDACRTVFFRQTFRNDFYPLDKANKEVNIALRTLYNRF